MQIATTDHSPAGPPCHSLIAYFFTGPPMLWIINDLVRPNHVDTGRDLI